MKSGLAVLLMAFVLVLSQVEGVAKDAFPVAGKDAWKDVNFSGLTLDLQDPRDVRWYLFHPDGFVSVTLGEKKGYIAAPLWYWRLKGDWLEILPNKKKKTIYYRMRPVKVGRGIIVMDNGKGGTETYKMSRQK